MAQPVVDGLEVVHVQQCQAQRRAQAAGAGDFAFHRLVQALAVEAAGQRVVARLGAGAVQFFLQLGNLGAFGLGALAQVLQFVVRHAAVQRHGAGGAHHILQHRCDLLQGAGLADQVGATLHGALVAGAGCGDARQPLDEGGQHFLHLLLRLQRPGLGFGLLEDHVLEPTLHIVQPPQRQRRGRGTHQCLGLALQPAVVHAEHGDVLEDHVQQLQQAGADGGLFFGGERQAVAEVAQHALRGGHQRGGRAQKGDELLRHVDDAGVVVAQRGQGVVNEAGHGLGKLGGKFAQRGGGIGHFNGLGSSGRVQPQVGITHHHALQRPPVLGDDGAFELPQKALLRGCLAGQHPLDAAQRPLRERLRAADARYFIVDREVVVWRGCQSACGQLFERLARDLGRWSVGHGGAPVSEGLECASVTQARPGRGWHTAPHGYASRERGGGLAAGPAVRSEAARPAVS